MYYKWTAIVTIRMRTYIRNSLTMEDLSKSTVPLSKRSDKGTVPLEKNMVLIALMISLISLKMIYQVLE